MHILRYKSLCMTWEHIYCYNIQSVGVCAWTKFIFAIPYRSRWLNGIKKNDQLFVRSRNWTNNRDSTKMHRDKIKQNKTKEKKKKKTWKMKIIAIKKNKSLLLFYLMRHGKVQNCIPFKIYKRRPNILHAKRISNAFKGYFWSIVQMDKGCKHNDQTLLSHISSTFSYFFRLMRRRKKNERKYKISYMYIHVCSVFSV